jgi:hypothetical protein
MSKDPAYGYFFKKLQVLMNCSSLHENDISKNLITDLFSNPLKKWKSILQESFAKYASESNRQIIIQLLSISDFVSFEVSILLYCFSIDVSLESIFEDMSTKKIIWRNGF